MSVALLAALVAALPAAAGEDVLVRARTDRTTVHQDETFQYTIEIARSGKVQAEPSIRVPDLSSAGFDAQTTFSSTSMVMAGQDVRLTTQHTYVLHPTRMGELTIPGPEVTYHDPERRKRVTLRADPVSVLVLPAGGIRDAKGPMRVPDRTWAYVAVGAGAAALAAVAGLVVWRRASSARLVVPAGPVAVRTTEEDCLEALQRARAHRDRGDVTAFYVALSDALRDYVHRKTGVATREVTTREILRGMERAGASPGVRRELAEILDEADAVKFAKRTPGLDRMDAHLAQAAAWVERLAAQGFSRPGADPVTTPSGRVRALSPADEEPTTRTGASRSARPPGRTRHAKH